MVPVGKLPALAFLGSIDGGFAFVKQYQRLNS